MTSLNLLVERGEVCKCLRAKSMYYDAAGEDPSGENEDSMWCAHTQSILGPTARWWTCATAAPAAPAAKPHESNLICLFL